MPEIDPYLLPVAWKPWGVHDLSTTMWKLMDGVRCFKQVHILDCALRENQGAERALETIAAQIFWECPLAHVETLAGDICFYIFVNTTLVHMYVLHEHFHLCEAALNWPDTKWLHVCIIICNILTLGSCLDKSVVIKQMAGHLCLNTTDLYIYYALIKWNKMSLCSSKVAM
jgi:hypothetical protein